MFYKMIENKCTQWYESERCTVKNLNFFLTSDSGCYTNVYHETRLEDVERTMIYLLTPEKFPLWLYEKQQNLVSKN